MWFKLAAANFSAKNLGKMSDLESSYKVTSEMTGLRITSLSSTKYTTKGDSVAVNGTITVSSGYKFANGSKITNKSGTTIFTAQKDYAANESFNFSMNITTDVILLGTATVDTSSGTQTTYTITYKYMSGSTSIKTQTTEQVPAGTTKTFSTSGAPSVSGYTCSSVSPSGQQTINSNITVTYNYTANAGSPSVGGDTGTIRWTNHGYQSSGGLTSNSKRAMARMAAVKGDIIRIEGLEGFTMVDLVAFNADGETTLGYTGATPAGINLTYANGVVTFQVPAASAFTNCSYVGLVIKYASEVAIDVSTLPTSYSKVLLPVVNQKFDSKTFTMVAESTRMALREPVEVKANRTITIANIPEMYVNDLSPVDMVFYNADKTYKKYASSYTMNFSGSNLVITIPSSTEIGTYVNVTMKCTSDPNSTIKTIKFMDSTVTSA